MDKKLIDKIRTEKESPLIAVIGATNPGKDYDKKIGIDAGYYLRHSFHHKKGNIFTGGVNGVGVDIYTGIIKYCINRANNLINDNFFILIPSYHWNISELDNHSKKVPYEPPSAYESLGHISRKGKLDKIVAGVDMEERRKYLAMIADIIIVINGGSGTIHEAIEGLNNNKPVINLFNTGGATDILKNFGEGKRIYTEGFIKEGDLLLANKKYLYQAKDTDEMINIIERLI